MYTTHSHLDVLCLVYEKIKFYMKVIYKKKKNQSSYQSY